MTHPHEMLELPFPIEQGLAWVRVPREGITAADADRMAEMVKAVVVPSTAAFPRTGLSTKEDNDG